MATPPTLPPEWKQISPSATSTAASKSQPRKIYYANLPDPNNSGKTLRLEAITDNNGNIKSYTFYDSNKKQFFNKTQNGDPLAAPGSNLSVDDQQKLITLATTQTTALSTSLGGTPNTKTIPGYTRPTATNAGLFNLDPDKLKDYFQFGSVDENLKKTDLQYPKDALYNKTQDYLQIGQYHYKPQKSGQLFSQNAAKEILTSGLQKTSALAEFLGIVKLPMPNNVTDSNNVSWGDDSMNNLSAAATADVIQNLGNYIGASATGGLVGAILGGNAQQGAALGAQGALLYKLLGSAGSESAQALLKTAGASKVLSMAGFSVSPESILARGFGVVPNSNLELLFNSPTLREFSFQYRMSPRSKQEATEINKIIRFFKQGMAAKKQDALSGNPQYGSAGAASYFLGTPNVFQLQYKTTGGKTIKGVNRIKTCALTGFAMNYAADGNWAAYDDGQPVSVIMNMSFKELEPIYDTDYQETIFDGRTFVDNTNNSGDLYPITPDEVGY
jgi:hypothetical protein